MSAQRLLAIETATEICSAALYVEGEVLERHILAPQQHAALILPMAESLLADAGLDLVQLDALAFGRGPGSFTGVRIAAGVIQGLAFGADLPVIPVSTLATIAQGVIRDRNVNRVLVALDARKQEVYWGAYVRNRNGLAALTGKECVVRPERIPLPDGGGWTGAGHGWNVCGEQVSARMSSGLDDILPDAEPHAGDVARLAVPEYPAGCAKAPEEAVPVYLRNRVVNT